MVIRHHLHNSPLHLALESDLQLILLALAIYLHFDGILILLSQYTLPVLS